MSGDGHVSTCHGLEYAPTHTSLIPRLDDLGAYSSPALPSSYHLLREVVTVRMSAMATGDLFPV